MQALRGQASGRVVSFVMLAALLATANTYGATLAASLFLSHVGARAIPLYYVLYAALSIPVSLAFTLVIDRWRRPIVFGALLLTNAGITIVISRIAGTDFTPAFYGLFLAITIFEQLNYSVFYVVLADYFTSDETNRSTGLIAVGMAVGGMIGGQVNDIEGEGKTPTAE